jgi:hypothetical protein
MQTFANAGGKWQEKLSVNVKNYLPDDGLNVQNMLKRKSSTDLLSLYMNCVDGAYNRNSHTIWR